MSPRDSAAPTARLLGCGWGCAFIGVQAGRQIPSSLFVVEFISKSWRLQRRERKQQVAGSWVISSTRVTEERPGRGLAVTWSGRQGLVPEAACRGLRRGRPAGVHSGGEALQLRRRTSAQVWAAGGGTHCRPSYKSGAPPVTPAAHTAPVCVNAL